MQESEINKMSCKAAKKRFEQYLKHKEEKSKKLKKNLKSPPTKG
jgi:hypothetical protein